MQATPWCLGNEMDKNYKGPLRGTGQAVGRSCPSLLVRRRRPDLSSLQVTLPLNDEEYAVKLKIATCQFPVSRDLDRKLQIRRAPDEIRQ